MAVRTVSTVKAKTKTKTKAKAKTEPAARVATPVAPVLQTLSLAVPEGALRLLACGLALLAPFGLLLGILYGAQPSPACRRFGQTCLLLAAAGFLGLVILAWVLVLPPMLSNGVSGPGVYY